jgi:tetratricopeptide (TPR) repeat protein
LFERIDPHTQTIIEILIAIADAYKEKGELNIALEYDEKALSLIPEGENFVIGLCKSIITQTIGDIYFQKGDLNNAFKYHSRVLENHRKYDFRGMMHVPYLKIISVILTQKNIAKARNYLEQFKQFKEIFQSKLSDSSYQLAYALILKTSPRMRDRVEAENILRKILKEYPNHSGALIALCELYFKEFRQSNQMEVLDDIQPLIEQLNGTAKRVNSYSLLAEIKLLQAKLTLIKLNLDDARKLLTEAQQIADDHGLQLLAGAISREHDRLLEELKLWESIKKTQASVAERLKLASIDSVMERLQGRRAIEPAEEENEEPISLLIMDKSGVPYFNHSFVENWKFEDLFSSFMSAFNTLSDEMFSESIDRIKIGENTILINLIEPFLACYIIKGQSYPAQQKLTQFSENVRSTTEIWDALTRAMNTGEMLELNDDPPTLGNIVNEIFISKR